MGKKKKDIMHLERESVIPVVKHKLVRKLADMIDHVPERDEFLKLCKRVEYTIRAWYLLQFEDVLEVYSLFDPVHGCVKLEKQNLPPEKIDILEERFLVDLFQILNKSNFKMATDEEVEVALSGHYQLNLPITVDESKVFLPSFPPPPLLSPPPPVRDFQIDSKLLRRYFDKYPQPGLPHFADKYVIFRRGIGIDQKAGYFFRAKLDTIIARSWRYFLRFTRMERFWREGPCVHPVSDGAGEIDVVTTDDDLFVERIRVENKLSVGNLLRKITIQEPTFDRIIVIYRRVSSKGKKAKRGIFLKHFKNIPMADMEIVLPEKKNPSLTPTDWVKFVVSALLGLAAVVGSLHMPAPDVKITVAVLSAMIGYCVNVYITYQKNFSKYQNMIMRAMYKKQLDSGRGTLLHLCDEVIQQEVKEVIVAFFVLMGRTEMEKSDIDVRCEDVILGAFGEKCNFEVDDAVQKLEKLGIVRKDENGRYMSVGLEEANGIIGTTTEEIIVNADDRRNRSE